MRIWWAPCVTGHTVADRDTPESLRSPPQAGGAPSPPVVLDEADWVDRARVHRGRVDEFLEPHLLRARAGEAHPVWDFLFTYYSLRPRQLRRWHPGYGVVLGGAAARSYLGRTGYGSHPAGVTVTGEHLRARAETVRFIAELLRATATRAGAAELLRAARVGDGVPGARGAPRSGAAATRAGRHRRRGRVNATALQPL